MTEPFAILMVLVACAIGSFGAMFLKKGAVKFSFKPKELIRNKNLILGASLYGISTAIFIPALKFGELSVLYPFASTSYIWVALLSVKYLNEEMNMLKWLGLVLIIIGVSVIGFGS